MIRPYPTYGYFFVTVRVTVIECFKLPLVPVMVIAEVPGEVLFVVATVKAEVEELGDVTVTGLGLNAQVLFAGHPLTVSVTLPLKVFRGVRVNGNVAVAPSLTVCVVVLDEMEKSGTITTKVTDVL